MPDGNPNPESPKLGRRKFLRTVGGVSAGLGLGVIFNDPHQGRPSPIGEKVIPLTTEQQKKSNVYATMKHFMDEFTNVDVSLPSDTKPWDVVNLNKWPNRELWELRLPKEAADPDRFYPTVAFDSRPDIPPNCHEVSVRLDRDGNLLKSVRVFNPDKVLSQEPNSVPFTEEELKRAFGKFSKIAINEENWKRSPEFNSYFLSGEQSKQDRKTTVQIYPSGYLRMIVERLDENPKPPPQTPPSSDKVAIF